MSEHSSCHNMVLKGYFIDNDWRNMLSVLRQFYQENCPRYDRETVEVNLGWVGIMFSRRESMRKRNGPVGDKNFGKMTEDEIITETDRMIDQYLADAQATYRRHFERIDNYPAAEAKIAEHLKRIGLGNLI